MDVGGIDVGVGVGGVDVDVAVAVGVGDVAVGVGVAVDVGMGLEYKNRMASATTFLSTAAWSVMVTLYVVPAPKSKVVPMVFHFPPFIC